MLFEVLIAAAVVMSMSLVGVLFLSRTSATFLENRLSFLVSFSAGVFLVTSGALALEVFEIADSLWQGALFIVLGYISASLLHRLMPETHHHHDEDCKRRHEGAARKLIVGDAIHNVADGVVLVVAYTASPALGLAALFSIAVHEALQEVSEFFILRRAGYSVRRALFVNFAVSSTILIGVLLGYFAIASHELEVILLALSAGFFMQVVIHDLLPRQSEHENPRTFLWHVGLVVVGALLMGFVAEAVSEGHAHSEQEEEHSESITN